MLHPELANHLATEKDKTSRTKHQRPKSTTKDGLKQNRRFASRVFKRLPYHLPNAVALTYFGSKIHMTTNLLAA